MLRSTSSGISLYYDPFNRLVEYDTTVSTRFAYDGAEISAGSCRSIPSAPPAASTSMDMSQTIRSIGLIRLAPAELSGLLWELL